MTRPARKPPGDHSIRALRMGEAMRHALAEVLARGEVRDEVLARHILSVSEVQVSPDLRHATAYVMPVGSDPAGEAEALRALNRHAPRFRAAVARLVNSRYAADIRFAIDSSYAAGERIDSLLRSPQVARDTAADDTAEGGRG